MGLMGDSCKLGKTN